MKPVAIPNDAAAIERGRYLYTSRGCVDCHAANGAGRAFIDSGDMKIAGPNISRGRQRGRQIASLRDWVRTLKAWCQGQRQAAVHAQRRLQPFDRRRHRGALIAYVKSLPPVPGDAGVVKLPLPSG